MSYLHTPSKAALSLLVLGLLGSSVINSAAEPFLYVATISGYPNYVSNFTVIDTETKKVVQTIPVSVQPINFALQTPMVVSPDGKAVYFISEQSLVDSTISALNTGTNKIGKPISVKRIASSLATSPNGDKVYVNHTNEHGGCGYGLACSFDFTTIDVRTRKVSVIPLPLSGGFAISPDGKRAYVFDFPNGPSDTIHVIDLTRNQIVKPLVLPNAVFQGIAFGPDGEHLYVTALPLGLLVVNIRSQMVEKTIPGVIGKIVITPDGKLAYAFGFMPGSVVDLKTNKIIASLPMNLYGGAVNPDGKSIYFLAYGEQYFSNSVSIMDTKSQKIVGSIPVANATALAIEPASREKDIAELGERHR
jgi:YVTN family beta-propeller protein